MTIRRSILNLILFTSFSLACFPYGDSTLPKDLSAPKSSLSDWWCPQSQRYGFQGFSYPLEDSDCSNSDNSIDQMSSDFAQMKKDFGATVVRMYYAECTQASVFEHALEAAVKSNMALIFQVWTNYGNGDVWKQSQQAIYDTLSSSKYKAIAPYVVQSADFGSEPVGDSMDGGGDQFVKDLGSFRKKLNSFGIPAGISEDWDRPGTMSSSSKGNDGLGTGLGSIGSAVRANSDFAHIHPMPYYHFNDPESQAFAYIQRETLWVKNHTSLPVTITETQWAWKKDDHNPGKSDVGVKQYTNFWKTFDSNCGWFKDQNVAWFLHAWQGEGGFDIKFDNGSYVIPNWKPSKC